MFSPAQQPHYRGILQEAWKAHCQRLGQNPAWDGAFDGWKAEHLVEAIGKPSTKTASQVLDFDLVMLHFAQIAGNDYWIKRASTNAERRMRYVIGQFLRELGRVEGRALDWSYVQGIHKHMGIIPPMDDCPVDLLWKILQALDTQIRRLGRRRSEHRHAA